MKKLDLKKYGISGTTEIVYNPTYDQLFKDELDKIQETCDKVKVIYVLANETKEGYEHGVQVL